ncbi:hypothetical protein PR048_018810, partial [Dryococelus australis]
MPYYLVAEDTFPLSTCLMEPYRYRDLPADKRILQLRARNTVENVFGIIAQRFLVLIKPMLLQLSTVEEVVLLYMLQGAGQRCLYPGPVNGDTHDVQPGEWRGEAAFTSTQGFHNSDEVPSQREVKEELTNYSITPEGEVRWQYRH